MTIKKVVQLGLLSSAVILLAGCGTTQNYASAINSWNGAPASALVRDWGHPNHEAQLHNGNQLYTYRVVEHESFMHKTYAPAPGFVRLSPQNNNTVVLSHPSKRIGNHEETFYCETSFEINKGVIVDTRFHGNNCVTTRGRAHRWAFAH